MTRDVRQRIFLGSSTTLNLYTIWLFHRKNRKPTTTNKTMNIKPRTAVIAFAITIATIVSGVTLLSTRSRAAGPVAESQYKVLSLQNYSDPEQLEVRLNGLASEGWIVRASFTTPQVSMRSGLILSK